jgi:hypothetical protein
MKDKIRTIIEDWDPYNLKPGNIYGPESFEILKCIRSSQTKNPDQIALYLQTVLSGYCPPNIFNASYDECLAIAKKIVAIID